MGGEPGEEEEEEEGEYGNDQCLITCFWGGQVGWWSIFPKKKYPSFYRMKLDISSYS